MSVDEYNEEDILIMEMSVTNINGFGSIFIIVVFENCILSVSF